MDCDTRGDPRRVPNSFDRFTLFVQVYANAPAPAMGGRRGSVRPGTQREVSFHRWSAVPLSSHWRTWAPEEVLMSVTPSRRPLL